MIEKKKEVKKCVNMGCYEDAIWKTRVTKEDIEKNKKPMWPLLTEGTYYHCNKHKTLLEANVKLKFESI